MFKGIIFYVVIKVVEVELIDGVFDVFGSCVVDVEQFEGFCDVDFLVI